MILLKFSFFSENVIFEGLSCFFDASRHFSNFRNPGILYQFKPDFARTQIIQLELEIKYLAENIQLRISS